MAIMKVRILPARVLMGGGDDDSPMLVTADEKGNVKGAAIDPRAIENIIAVVERDVTVVAREVGWYAPIPKHDPRSYAEVWRAAGA